MDQVTEVLENIVYLYIYIYIYSNLVFSFRSVRRLLFSCTVFFFQPTNARLLLLLLHACTSGAIHLKVSESLASLLLCVRVSLEPPSHSRYFAPPSPPRSKCPMIMPDLSLA